MSQADRHALPEGKGVLDGRLSVSGPGDLSLTTRFTSFGVVLKVYLTSAPFCRSSINTRASQGVPDLDPQNKMPSMHPVLLTPARSTVPVSASVGDLFE